MTAAYNYFNQLTLEIQTDESHGSIFHGSRTSEFINPSFQPFHNRMKLFEHNMNKWGRRFDRKHCYCNEHISFALQDFANNVPAQISQNMFLQDN